MLTKIVLISLIAASNCWPFSKFDPQKSVSILCSQSYQGAVNDIDICKNPYLDGGVVAEDGETYLFKGDYYWKTRPLTIDSGIVGFAELTSNKWPEIKDNIKLVFTVSKDNSLITIFVVKNKWFGYQKGVKTMDGSVDSWPEFKNLKVTTALTPTYGANLVYVLYSDNNYYILYDFTNLSKPRKVRSGVANIRSNYLLFTEESSHSIPGMSIKTLIDLRAALTYTGKMFLLSAEKFCVLNLIAKPFERECNLENVMNLLGCPLDISKRLTVTSTTTPTTTETITSLSTSTTNSSLLLESSSHSVSIEEPVPSDWDFKDSSQDFNQPIRTGIPILGKEMEEEEGSDDFNTTYKIASGLEAAIIERNKENSEFWVTIIIVVVIAIAVSAVLVVGVVSKVTNKKRRKGELILIK